MSGKNTAVFGIYATQEAAEEAVTTMRNAGFRSTDISVLLPQNLGTKDLAHEKNTKAPEGAATGGVAGGIAGGVLGWLTGIGALAIPGIGPLIAAGPIVAALAGVGAVGALGGIVGALAGMGVPEYEAKRYEGRIRDGGVLLSVHCDSRDWVKRAKEMLAQTGAQDIASASEKHGDFANTEKPMPRVRTAAGGSVAPPPLDEEIPAETPSTVRTEDRAVRPTTLSEEEHPTKPPRTRRG